jgi:hypothetical protein
MLLGDLIIMVLSIMGGTQTNYNFTITITILQDQVLDKHDKR